ncbi:MAG: D-alanyl-D-alanine carboxypeptidase/D-alanyl-D-alanine endopeptidase [cyanobacterium endosymbiont of Rhopalodia musculus]|uniref:D-alanyl-D-alanine carboxypeptidase/D-alanyl-D-alanine endopeptidase n=1 Tax=cyanobacterium endosymbiont of Epithemia clementina EcSB TaxID=3034674 RepID=UPI002480A8E5|nr:D-alanyl-D-alanine carboxypeptidase/D-alanyl-D-alanine-endopeptidase [cyanobacterium endosymbiont of Epithemia clementina EcSB]WGT67663.1 D-alanyl-D-alanine carboxypeptidase/D-alanyl-D-alanine-endopeptidase [cyanobacterium endosymbiont of Epithemia clementina EcSB]
MKRIGFYSQYLAILATISLTWGTSSIADETNSITTTDYFQGQQSIEIYVPQPEPRTSGTCVTLIEPAIASIMGSYRANWGILVEKLEEETTLYSHNADKFFIPASNIKLFTTAAALQKLNPQSKIKSKSLQDWIKVTNVRSNNYYADTLLSHIGGAAAAKSALAQMGVNPNSFRQADGSGLSRRNLATPRSLIMTLRAMYYAPDKDVFYSSLPIAGISGTLRNRMKGTPAQGKVYAKTGTLRGVRALSGYMNHPDFGKVVFSILVNNPRVSGSSLVRAIDRIVLQLNITQPCE